jgi:hypothetical protein
MAERKPREGWEESFAEARRRGDLELTEEDLEWLNAPLTNDDWWEWDFTDEEMAQAPNMIFTSTDELNDGETEEKPDPSNES